jgi:AcrR family transcriptional regulator
VSDPARRRGRPPRLTRDAIEAAALALLDERGLEGFTMRLLATRLEADPMAVYRHFRNKDDLLAAISDDLLTEFVIDPEAGWREETTRLMRRLRQRLAAHPGLGAVVAEAPLTPASVATWRQAVELFEADGFRPEVARASVSLLISYVLGYALIERAAAQQVVGSEAAEELPAIPAPEDFDIGLAVVLDGLAAQPVAPMTHGQRAGTAGTARTRTWSGAR